MVPSQRRAVTIVSSGIARQLRRVKFGPYLHQRQVAVLTTVALIFTPLTSAGTEIATGSANYNLLVIRLPATGTVNMVARRCVGCLVCER